MEAKLASFDDGFVLNKLTPNKKKCETIFFANQVKIKKCSGLTIKFYGIKLETKSSVKYLGIHFDSTLSWERHIKEVKKKIKFKLSKTRPLSKFVD